MHEQQRVDEEQDKRIVKLSIKSCRRRVIKQARFRRRWKDHRRHARLGRRHRDEASAKLAAKLIQSKKMLPHQLLKEAEAETQTSWSSEPQRVSAAWSDRLLRPLCRGAAQRLCKAQSPRSERMFADHTESVMVRFKCSGCECRCNVCKSGTRSSTRCGCGCHTV